MSVTQENILAKNNVKTVLTAKLFSYLKSSNHELLIRLETSMALRDFINDRVNAATDIYLAALEADMLALQAEELAYNELYKGIEFSTREHVESVLMTELPGLYYSVDEDELALMMDKLLQGCGDIYDKNLNNENVVKIVDDLVPTLLMRIKLILSAEFSDKYIGLS